MEKDDAARTYTHIQWDITQPYEERNYAICGSMDGPRDYYKNKVRERQTPYDIPYMWNLKD